MAKYKKKELFRIKKDTRLYDEDKKISAELRNDFALNNIALSNDVHVENIGDKTLTVVDNIKNKKYYVRTEETGISISAKRRLQAGEEMDLENILRHQNKAERTFSRLLKAELKELDINDRDEIAYLNKLGLIEFKKKRGKELTTGLNKALGNVMKKFKNGKFNGDVTGAGLQVAGIEQFAFKTPKTGSGKSKTEKKGAKGKGKGK